MTQGYQSSAEISKDFDLFRSYGPKLPSSTCTQDNCGASLTIKRSNGSSLVLPLLTSGGGFGPKLHPPKLRAHNRFNLAVIDPKYVTHGWVANTARDVK